jgi:hypothetical protein
MMDQHVTTAATAAAAVPLSMRAVALSGDFVVSLSIAGTMVKLKEHRHTYKLFKFRTGQTIFNTYFYYCNRR